MQRLAFFDLDDTLVDRSRGFRSCVRAFCSDLSFAWDVEQWLLEAMYERAYRSDFERLRERFAVSVPVEELWQRYTLCMAGAVTCAPEVLSGLERLRDAGWLVGVVTNGAGDIQRAKMASAGLDLRVDAVCISEEVGCRKPDVGIFHEAVRLVGADGHLGGWTTGDSAQNDVTGGRAAGLRTIWISDGTDRVVEADHVVSGAADAIDLLLGLEGARV
ncbi:HAD family hydrolase [Streptomyces sp. JJ66]|uniref:HAD family hydrolase n=1 Tax=Streptomyces sp. JJ66 TaxID=2803843 RepID=UPI001C56A6C4|nr:HAD family hydrolase [Streptomyces sp. JJ66]MBW1603492.1 HAD family hydrolase [Streptomyces sp. JJ66]